MARLGLYRRRRWLGRVCTGGAAERGPQRQGAAARGRPTRQVDLDRPSGRLLPAHARHQVQLGLRDGAGGQCRQSRAIPCPRGRTLGGSSSINGMLYVRGQPLDYDTWAQQGNRGWSYDQVLPYFKKSEHYEGKGDESRGKNGPLNVADMIERHELCDAFVDAAEGMGYPRNPDYNNGKQEGFGYYQTTMKGGKRWSTARAFIDPIRHRPNLDIETDALASRLLIEGKRCVGVAYTIHGREKQARAHREVIVSCGAVQSPQLLELSGIGQPELLKSHGIEVRHELKGAGRELRRPLRAAHELAGEEQVHPERTVARSPAS